MDIRNINLKSLLFDNKSIKQTVFKNTFWLGAAEAASRVFKLILMIYVARILGATEYGKITFALAYIALFSVLYESGLPLIVTREFSGEKEKEKEFYSVLSLKIVLSLGSLILILIGSFFVTSDYIVREIILILAIFSLISSFLVVIYAFYQARQRMEYQAWGTILQAAIITPVGIYVLLKFPSVVNFSYSYLFSSLGALIFVLLFSHFKVISLKIAWQKAVWQKYLKMSWPVAFIALFGIIYTYISSVMMGYMGLITETGWYNAAYSIIQVVLLPASLISTSFYPVLSKLFKESKERFQHTLESQMKVMILLAIPIVAGGIALAPKIITFIYGLSFSSSILVFQILITIAGFVYLSSPFHFLFIAINQQKKIFYINAAGAAINIILNLILIPRFTLYGSAVATVITYFVMFVLMVIAANKFTAVSLFNFRLAKYLILAVFAAGSMYFLVKQPFVYNLNIVWTLIVGIVVYFVVFFIFHKITRNYHSLKREEV